MTQPGIEPTTSRTRSGRSTTRLPRRVEQCLFELDSVNRTLLGVSTTDSVASLGCLSTTGSVSTTGEEFSGRLLEAFIRCFVNSHAACRWWSLFIMDGGLWRHCLPVDFDLSRISGPTLSRILADGGISTFTWQVVGRLCCFPCLGCLMWVSLSNPFLAGKVQIFIEKLPVGDFVRFHFTESSFSCPIHSSTRFILLWNG